MWNAATFQRVYDTGDDMEREASRATNGYSTTFNGECSNVNLSPVREADLRSDNYVCYELGVRVRVRVRVRVMAVNITFNNISVISRLSVLLGEETGVSKEHHQHDAMYVL